MTLAYPIEDRETGSRTTLQGGAEDDNVRPMHPGFVKHFFRTARGSYDFELVTASLQCTRH